ncbi:MAG: DNA polymerase III subunit gamma/tau [Candidatus Buchananbacteria bacterium]|jgi:DNA polymerase-3 subunit gamma/tau
MSSALYRKYRPQSFSQMIGQNHIKITLQHELAKGDIGHAYLFCGPRGLGKTTSARLFAKSVNCEKRQPGESEPCNECPSCLDIIAGRQVDIIEIDAASNTGVDNVRENIIENSRFNPVRSKFKVFIIDEVHMLSTSAFNALLKIMEEPPAHVIFILCTTEIHKVPPTIISRCQRFDFKKVTGEQMLKRLQLVVEGENKKVEEEVLKRIIVNSEGCVRDAESLLAKVLSLGDDITADQAEIVLPRSDFESVSSFVGFLAENNSAAAIELINRLMDDGVDLVIFVDSLLEFLRQMLLVKTSGRLENYGIELSNDLSKGVMELAEKFNWAEIVDMIEVISTKGKEIRQSSIPQLPLEIAVIRITQKVSCQKPDTISFVAPSAVAKPRVLPPIASAVAQDIVKKPEVPQEIATVEEKKSESSNNASLDVVTETAANIVSSDEIIEYNLETVVAKWPNIVQRLLIPNFTLSSLLKMSQPIKVDNGYIQIAVTSEFYRGRLESTNNRTVIEAVIEAEIGQKILIKGVVSANVQPIEMTLDYTDPDAVEPPTIVETAAAAISSIKLDPAEEVMNMF